MKALATRDCGRIAVAPADTDLVLKEGVKYVVSQSEEGMPLRLEMKALAEKMYP